MRIMRALMWTHESVTMRQCPVILSSRCLKIMTIFWEMDLFKIFRN